MQPPVHSSRSSTSGIPTSACRGPGDLGDSALRSFDLAAARGTPLSPSWSSLVQVAGPHRRPPYFFVSLESREKSSLSFMCSADYDQHNDRACAGPNLRGKSSRALYQSLGEGASRGCLGTRTRAYLPANHGRSSWFQRVLIHVNVG